MNAACGPLCVIHSIRLPSGQNGGLSHRRRRRLLSPLLHPDSLLPVSASSAAAPGSPFGAPEPPPSAASPPDAPAPEPSAPQPPSSSAHPARRDHIVLLHLHWELHPQRFSSQLLLLLLFFCRADASITGRAQSGAAQLTLIHTHTDMTVGVETHTLACRKQTHTHSVAPSLRL